MDTAVWSALADENRRAILGRLLAGPQPVGELAERCGLSQPSMSKHLRVLREAGLVRVQAEAQRRVYALEPAPMAELDAWLAPYRRLWNRSLDALGRRLDEAPARGGEQDGHRHRSTHRRHGEDDGHDRHDGHSEQGENTDKERP